MRNLTLKQLRYSVALATQGHFGQAAAICAVSQPALSVQIKELEAALGQTLFERGGRHVRLTAFGEAFVARAKDILAAVDELGDLARAAGDGLARLRLGVIPTVAPYLLPTVLPYLAKAQPDLDVSVRETVTPRLIAELQAGRIDAAIVALPLTEPGLTARPILSEGMVLVQPGDIAASTDLTARDLADLRLLLLEEGHCFRDQALAYCNLPTSGLRDGLEGSSLSTLVQMVGAGIGATLIPDMAVPVETRSADVSVSRFAAPGPTRALGLVYRESNPLGPHLDSIADMISHAVTDRETASA